MVQNKAYMKPYMTLYGSKQNLYEILYALIWFKTKLI